MTTTKEVIKYKVYRGELEPVTEQRVAEIKLYDNYIELITDYSFTPYLPEPDGLDYIKAVDIFPKQRIFLELTEECHEKDNSKSMSPILRIACDGSYTTIRVEYPEEAYNIYKKIKTWLLNDNS